MAENTIKTRIQLKSDTETNWGKSALIADGGTKTSGSTFVPKKGEVVIYSTDDSHPFSRLKVGNGVDSVPKLPFLQGSSAEFVVSTNSASSAALTGTLTNTTLLTNGKIIYYMLTYPLPPSAATLTLQYPAGNSTTAIPIYTYGTTQCITAYPAPFILTLIFYNDAFYLAANNISVLSE